MQDIHKNWRNFLHEAQRPEPVIKQTTLTEEELVLIGESRVEDAKKKYSGVERFVDRLADADPSKNNKYLMWMMKQLDLEMRRLMRVAGDDAPSETVAQDVYFTSLFNYSIKIGEVIEDFHKNAQRLKNKDINSYKTLEDVETVNRELGFSKRLKRKGEKIKALQDVEVLIENDYFYIARPYTVEAAAELGGARGATSWCIARGACGEEWFTKYTGEGKSFYYIISKYLPKPPKSYSSMTALTYQHGDLHAINDGDNQDIDEGDFEQNFFEVMFAGTVVNPEKALEVWNDMSTGEPTPEVIQKVITALVRDFGGEYDEDIEDVTDVDEIYDVGNRIISSLIQDIMYVSRGDAEENPAGPKEEDFNEILNEFDFNHVWVSLNDPMDYGGDRWLWEAGAQFELPDDLPWVDTGDGSPVPGDYEDELVEIFQEKADTEGYRHPDETEWDDYAEEINMRFNPAYDEIEGPPAFKDFCESMKQFDDNYDDVQRAALEEIKNRGYIKTEAYTKRKKLFDELPDFKNFDVKLEKGEIKVFTQFELDLSGFLQAIKFNELEDTREDHQRSQAEPSTTQRAYAGRLIRTIERHLGGNSYSRHAMTPNAPIVNDWVASTAMMFKSVTAQSEKQIELPLSESQRWEPISEVPRIDFLALKTEISPAEKMQGTILFNIPIKLDAGIIQETLRYITWLDRYFNQSMDLLRKSILQSAEIEGRKAKDQEPQLFKSPDSSPAAAARALDAALGQRVPASDQSPASPTPESPEALTEKKINKLLTTHKNIHESWSKYLQKEQ